MKEEIQGSSNKTRQELNIDIMKLKNELTESFINELNKIKSENLSLKEEIINLKHQQMPTGAIIEWQNPSKNNLIKIQTSKSMYSNHSIHDIINRETETNCGISPQSNNWFIIDFKDIQIKPTQYTL